MLSRGGFLRAAAGIALFPRSVFKRKPAEVGAAAQWQHHFAILTSGETYDFFVNGEFVERRKVALGDELTVGQRDGSWRLNVAS